MTDKSNTSIDEIRLHAENGNADAQYWLGFMHFCGSLVVQDDAAAARWFLCAATQGHPTAQNDLGVLYANGRGVPQDDQEAVKWYARGAEGGNFAAQMNFGRMLYDGRGIRKNDEQALFWSQLAADGGDDTAKSNVEFISRHLTTEQVANVKAQAIEWQQAHFEDDFETEHAADHNPIRSRSK